MAGGRGGSAGGTCPCTGSSSAKVCACEIKPPVGLWCPSFVSTTKLCPINFPLMPQAPFTRGTTRRTFYGCFSAWVPGKRLCCEQSGWEERSVPEVIITLPVGLSLSPVPPMLPIPGARRDKGICPPVAEDVQTLVTFEAMGLEFHTGRDAPPASGTDLLVCPHISPRGSSCSF